jgi:2',3'-cyclic-nucleotide 2'-phosphodiesterase (5'-nucleotidase family)
MGDGFVRELTRVEGQGREMARSDLEGDLRATAEDIAADAAQIKAIEEKKASLDADDPEVQELAAKSEQLARRLVAKTVAEREITEAIGDTSGG